MAIGAISRELGVSYVLEGSVRRAGQRVRVTAQLIQSRDESHVWADSYERTLDDVLELQCEVARAIAQEIRVKLTSKRSGGLAFLKSDPRLDPLHADARFQSLVRRMNFP